MKSKQDDSINLLTPSVVGLEEVKPSGFIWNTLMILWVLHVVRPLWLLAYYMHPLKYTKMLPTLILLMLFLIWLFRTPNKNNHVLILLLLLEVIFSSLFAINGGRARVICRVVFEIYLIVVIMMTYVNSFKRFDKIVSVYIYYFILISIYGITGKGRVEWDMLLNEEDSFGPLMVIGVALGYHYYLGFSKGKQKIYALLVSLFCLAGVVVSFARGSFLCLLAIIVLILYRSKQKIKGGIIVVCSLLP
jgi:hypothetical protein